jgi:hypothetical protein
LPIEREVTLIKNIILLSNQECAKEIRVIVLNTTFNNISVISWQSVLLVEETRVSAENHRPVASHCAKGLLFLNNINDCVSFQNLSPKLGLKLYNHK